MCVYVGDKIKRVSNLKYQQILMAKKGKGKICKLSTFVSEFCFVCILTMAKLQFDFKSLHSDCVSHANVHRKF